MRKKEFYLSLFIKLVALTLTMTSVLSMSENLYRDENERRALFTSQENSTLPGFTIKTVTVRSSIDCLHECLKNRDCVSVNYQTEGNVNHLCELCNQTIKALYMSALCANRKPGYRHLEPPFQDRIPCQNSPCLNGATCLQDCSQPSGYRCQCSIYTTGQSCESWTAVNCIGLALGLQNGRISDSQITASSYANNYHLPKYARLRLTPGANDAGSWRGRSNIGEYLQVDLLAMKMITKVATQGRPIDKFNRNQWITKYSLAYSVNGVTWIGYRGQEQTTKMFTGNSDRNTVVTNSLGIDVPIAARYVRIVVQGFAESPSLRAELYGCDM